MLVAGLALAMIAALIHVYIFVLESLRWTDPRTRAVFGTSEEQAGMTRQLAFNQGFYNLFLAVAAFLGAILVFAGADTAGKTLTTTGTASMVLAGLVLLLSDRTKVRAALVQVLAPALSLVALLVAALV
jgi:putative membrane protein